MVASTGAESLLVCRFINNLARGARDKYCWQSIGRAAFYIKQLATNSDAMKQRNHGRMDPTRFSEEHCQYTEFIEKGNVE